MPLAGKAPEFNPTEEELRRRIRELEEENQGLRQEIEERIRAEQALKVDEEKWRTLVQNTPDVVARFDQELRHVFVSQSVERELGAKAVELEGKTHAELGMISNAVEDALDKVREVFRTGEPGNSLTHFVSPPGLSKYFHSSLVPEFGADGQVKTVLSISRDLTKEVHRKLLLNSVLDSSIHGICAIRALRDGQQRVVDFEWLLVNKAAELLLQRSEAQLKSRTLLQTLSGNKTSGLFDLFVGVINTGETLHHVMYYDYDHLNAWYQIIAVKLEDGLVVTFADITRLKKAEGELQRANRKLQQEIAEKAEAELRANHDRELMESVIEHSIDGISAFDKDGYYTLWNKALEQYSGLRREEVMGKHVFEVYPELKGTYIGGKVVEVLQGKHAFLTSLPFTKRREGYYELNLVPIFDQHGVQTGGITIMHDISESVKLKEVTISQKLSQQKDNLKVVLQTQEEERKRIAEALHNGLGQLLYVIKMHLEQCKKPVAASREVVSDMEQLLEEAIRETRTISFELMPSILQDFGLEVTLTELCKRLSKASVKISLSKYECEGRLEESVEIGVYRIVQELVNNVLKHAEASEAEIEVKRQQDRLRLVVRDNGKGFNLSAGNLKKGVGLLSIRNRLKLLNGKLKVESGASSGTVIKVLLPL
ncbi:MAG: PAS domain-containing protein [Hymenobacteraceae bacterium]|nr:PAS domain-containing protein [Hymenobacteraceae bacterium]